MAQATLGSSPYRNSSLFSGYYLDERIDDLEEWDCDEEAEMAFEELRSLWEAEGDLLRSYNEDELLGAWIDEVLDVLGFDTLQETTLPESDGYNDRLLFDSSDSRRKAARQKRDGNVEGMYGLSSAILEAKQYDADFDTRFDESRSYHDASHQIRFYLDRAGGEVEWGILTNGKQWRLYGTKDYATEIYYEVDLVSLLANGNLADFKYFYAFFRSAAFRKTAGTTFLDTVWNESETAAQELGEDLQNNVFTALRVLGEGFVQTNDLDIDPDDAEARAELKEQSLVLLYRLMFVLYAESRGLMRPEDPDDRDEFDEHFSLDQMRLDIHDDLTSGDSYDDFSTYSTRMWSQLDDLFGLIDKGNESLGIPPYNGGLFDNDEHEFLAENEVADQYIAEVIHRLGTTKDDDGDLVLADYADLDTRHLGTIYEGLLEHEFRIAPEQYVAVSEDGGQVWKPATDVSVAEAVEIVEKGNLYVVNDDGERKATGAYYTPDYVVSYIVEETIDPLLDEIRAELEADGLELSDQAYFGRFYKQVLNLKILDPAMGSAHFLTSATGYLTEQVMEVVREQELQGRNEQELRRTIAKECIYGVDINGMAVELGKLSMWLETLAADKPLAFLDHHLKAGNSLVGSDITDVLSDDAEENEGQLTLGQAFARARQKTLGHVMELMQDLLAIDNDELADIKSMEELYDKIRADPLYQRLFEVANVHTAEQFGLDVPDGIYEDMAAAIDDEDEWEKMRGKDWFTSAQATAAEQSFFHWELEFPEVFFSEDGGQLDEAGFDAVIGNPPYVRQEQISELKPYLTTEYSSFDSAADLYIYFLEKGHRLTAQHRMMSYIVSNKFMMSSYGEGIRRYLNENSRLRTLIDFHDLPVFSRDVSTYPLIIGFKKSQPDGDEMVDITKVENLLFDELSTYVEENQYTISQDDLTDSLWNLADRKSKNILNKMDSLDTTLTDYIGSPLYRGVLTGLNAAFVIDAETKESLIGSDDSNEQFIYPLLKGDDISRYSIDFQDRYIIRIPSGWSKDHAGCESEDKAWEWFSREFSALASHLSQYEDKAKSRYDRGDCWWELRPCDYYNLFEESKVIYPDISDGSTFAFDDTGYHMVNTCYFFPTSSKSIVALLNSSLITWYYEYVTSEYRGGYNRSFTNAIEDFPIPENALVAESELDVGVDVASQDTTNREVLDEIGERMIDLVNRREELNLSLLDHLGSYSNGHTLAKIGLTQPPSGSANSTIQQTATEKSNLRLGTVNVVRETENTVEIQLTARYKPDDEDAYVTDQWGYTETDPQPALRITDLTPPEADLIEAFVPVAVDEAGGFADFRETATKTNSLVDRLRKLTLPAFSDVEAGLDSYIQTKERADELEAKIERTDELIDEIVYELYGLTDEEIEIVEEAVNG